MSECRYYDMCRRVDGDIGKPVCAKAGRCALYSPMPDVAALAALADRLEAFREGTCDGCVANGGERGRGCAEALARAVADGIRGAYR